MFGRGDVSLARQLGLETQQVASPAQLMKAFAGAFRRIVQAPYAIDNEVAAAPSFDIKPDVREAWIVVYGDDSLRGASLTGPQGTIQAGFARPFRGTGISRMPAVDRPSSISGPRLRTKWIFEERDRMIELGNRMSSPSR